MNKTKQKKSYYHQQVIINDSIQQSMCDSQQFNDNGKKEVRERERERICKKKTLKEPWHGSTDDDDDHYWS